MLKLALKILFLSPLICHQAFAATALKTTNTTAVKVTKKVEKKDEKRFSMGFELSNSQNVFESSQYEKSNTFSLELTPAYKISDQSSVSASASLFQDPKDKEHPVVLTATTLNWSLTKYELRTNTIFKPILVAVLPTNSLQFQNERFQGAIGAKGSFRFSSVANLPFDISFASAVRKNFNEYTQSASGDDLTEYSFPQDLVFEYKFNSSFSASLFTRYIFAQSYRGQLKQAFVTDLSLSYSIHDRVQLSAGISNEGKFFKADGVESNFRYFNDQTSEIHFGIATSI